MPKKRGILVDQLDCRLPKPELCQPPVRNFDLAACIMEEVALEGLDGITLQALFVRLSTRPGFQLTIADKTKAYIWEMAKRLRHLSIFYLDDARDDLQLLDRRDHVDDRGNMYEPVTAPEDIYPYHPIDDQLTGTRGSCKEYYTRTPCDSVARRLKLNRIEELYGNKLVLVAPQPFREKILTSDDSSVDLGDLTVIQYCIVERVARSRYVGEITRGKVSLASMKIDPKSSFYQRKLLLKKGIITKQAMSMKFGQNRVTAGVSILHLPKFYTYYESVLKSSVSKVIKSIHAAPLKRKEVTQLRHEVGKHQLANLLSLECSQIFEELSLPFHEAYPDAYELETIPEKRVKLTQKFVKFLTLRDLRITPLNFAGLLLNKAGEEKEEAEDLTVAHLPIRFHTSQSTILHNFLHTIYESRAKGASLSELSDSTRVTPLDARSAVRQLQRHKAIIPILEDKKKTKMHRYVFYKFKEANCNYQAVSKASVAQASSSTVGEKPVFIDLEPNQQAVEGEIIWTVQELAGVEVSSSAGTSSTLDPTWPPGCHRVEKLTSNQVVKRRKRRGNSYVHFDAAAAQAPTPELKLTPEVRRVMESFLSCCDPEAEEYRKRPEAPEVRFQNADERDFVPIREPGKARCLVYINPTGWQILAEAADLRRDYGKLPSFATTRTTDRGNFILELIYKSRVIIGFHQILRGIRVHENKEEKIEIDRRTLYRILAQLQCKELIQILRIRIQKESITRLWAIFTPFSVSMESKLITSCIEYIVAATEAKSRQTLDERKAKHTRNRLVKSGQKKPIRPRPPGITVRTTVRARPGSKPGSKILKKVVRGARYANKAGVKPKQERRFDARDLEALSRIKRVRVDWTPVEDRFILASFLASVLFVKDYNYQRVFMFNAPQLRDLLHMKVERGRCKTSLAIRRRLHFLMKRHAFYSRYRYYLSEALQDLVLYDRHLRRFHETKYEKMFYRIPSEPLLAVIEYLQQKFHKLSIDPNVMAREALEMEGDMTLIDIPTDAASLYAEDGLEDVPERRVSIAFQQPAGCMMVDTLDTPFDLQSVSVWTARTAILSLVMSGDDVANVHRFLASISDDVLSYTINAMRVVGLTTWQKEITRFGPSVALKRKLLAGLGPDKYSDASKFLVDFGETAQRSFPATDQTSVGVFYILCELNSQNLLNFQITLPDPIVTIHPEWHEVFQTIAEGVGNSNAAEDDGEFITSDVLDESNRFSGGGVKRKRPSTAADKQQSATSSKRRKLERFEMLERQAFAEASVNPLQEALRRSKSSLSPAKAMRMSNKAMRLIRSEINSNHSSNFVERHFFSVNLPGIEVLGDREAFQRIITNGARPKLTLKEIKMHLVKVIPYTRIALTDAVEVISKPGKLGRWEQLYDYIASTKGVGVSLQFLRTKFTRKTLNEGLRSLIIKNAIFLVGVTYRKFVAVEFVECWTMPILHAQDSLLVQRVVFRPWITSTGRVHWAVIDQTLAAVLGYVNLHPDLTVEALCEHFTPVLSPVETMIVIDALVGFEFFNLYELERKVTKPSAFSPPSLVSKNYSVDTFLDMESLYVELNALTASKYSKLQQLFASEENLDLLRDGTLQGS